MGQYYRCVFVQRVQDAGLPSRVIVVAWFCPYAAGGGGKLLEHALSLSSLPVNVSGMLCPGGLFSDGARVVWAGDYADSEHGSDENLYAMCDGSTSADTVAGIRVADFPYLVNLDKGEYVVCDYASAGTDDDDDDDDAALRLHPLPILTVEGNGRGGGDLPPCHPWHPYAGAWARCMLKFVADVPVGMTQLVLP